MRWTLVTGGAKRLGAEICRSLAKEGRNVLIHYRTSGDEAEMVAEECRSAGVKAQVVCGDFVHPEGVQELIRKILKDKLEIENLVNNVGNLHLGSALETSPETWAELFQTNFHAPLALIQAFLPTIKKGKGSIINIGSAGSVKVAAATKFTAYSLTKNALFRLTQSLAKELAPFEVRVNMVSPGEIDNSVVLRDPKMLPMHRAATTKEIARVVAFLINKENSYITGQNIEVAGGLAL